MQILTYGLPILVIWIMIVFSILISYGLIALQLISSWFIMKKTGEPGWKGIIPFYGSYVFFKKVWNTAYFWAIIGIDVGVMVIGSILSVINRANEGVALAVIILMCVLLVAAVVALLIINAKYCNRIAKSFGRSKGFAVGLFFLDIIFCAILAFDKSRYIGNTTEQS